MQEVAEEYNGGWIPCSERLPKFTPDKKQRTVLVTLEDPEGKRFTTKAKYNEKDGFWHEFEKSRYVNFKVIAWMPKQEPYKE